MNIIKHVKQMNILSIRQCKILEIIQQKNLFIKLRDNENLYKTKSLNFVSLACESIMEKLRQQEIWQLIKYYRTCFQVSLSEFEIDTNNNAQYLSKLAKFY